MTALKTYIVSAILAIVFTTQDTLWATPNHPFWHKGHYVEASTLHAGDTIEALEGYYSHIQQIITISGERKPEAPAGDEKVAVHIDERFFGRFRRVVTLPEDADPDGVVARYRDGVLQISVKRKQASQPRRINIQ